MNSISAAPSESIFRIDRKLVIKTFKTKFVPIIRDGRPASSLCAPELSWKGVERLGVLTFCKVRTFKRSWHVRGVIFREANNEEKYLRNGLVQGLGLAVAICARTASDLFRIPGI